MKKKEKNKKEPDIKKSNLDILKIRHYDEKLDCFVLADESLLDFYSIIPRDVDNMEEDEFQMELYHFIKILRTVGTDIKLISMNFPLNTTGQRRLLEYYIEHAENEIQLKWLQREIDELEILDETIHTANFYLMYFGENEKEFLKNREQVQKYATSGIDKFAEEIPKLQKIQVLVKICNMNGVYDLHFFEQEGSEDE